MRDFNKRIIKPHILLSGFIKDSPFEQDIINKIQKLGGVFFNSTDFNLKCTHIVCAKPSGSEKYLGACASGKYVVTTQFVEDSFTRRYWQDASNYEWKEDMFKPDSTHPPCVYSAPSRCRKRIEELGGKGMFKNWRVLLHLENTKRKSVYRRILHSGGATLVFVKFPLSKSDSIPHLTHVFVDNNKAKDVKILMCKGIPCISTDYIRHYLLMEPCPNIETFSINEYSPYSTYYSIKNAKALKDVSSEEENKNWEAEKLSKTLRKRKSNEKYSDLETISSSKSQKRRLNLSESDIHQNNVKIVSPLSSQNCEDNDRKMVKCVAPIFKNICSSKLTKKQMDIYNSLKSTPDGKHQRTLHCFFRSKLEVASPKEEFRVGIFDKLAATSEVGFNVLKKENGDSSNSVNGKNHEDKKYNDLKKTSKVVRRSLSANFVAGNKNSENAQSQENLDLEIIFDKKSWNQDVNTQRSHSSPNKTLTQQFLNVTQSPKKETVLVIQSPKKAPPTEGVQSSPKSSSPAKTKRRPSAQAKLHDGSQKSIKQFMSPSPIKKVNDCVRIKEGSLSSPSSLRKITKNLHVDLQSSLHLPSGSHSSFVQSAVPGSAETVLQSSCASDVGMNVPACFLNSRKSNKISVKKSIRSEENKLRQNHELSDSTIAIFEACLDELYYLRALDFMSSVISFHQYPPAKCLNTIMFKLLLKSEDEYVCWRANSLLFKILSLHPPKSQIMRQYYFNALCAHDDGDSAFLHNLVSECLQHFDCDEVKTKVSSSQLLLTFICEIITQDFLSVRSQSDVFKKNYIPIVARIFWPNTSSDYINNHCRKFLNLVAKCIVACNSENTNFRYFQQILLQMGRIIYALGEYCRIKSSDITSEREIGVHGVAFARELASILNGYVTDGNSMKLALRIIRPTWLGLKVTEFLCDEYQNLFAPQPDLKLSMQKIVNQYMYMIPDAKVDTPENLSPHKKALDKIKSAVVVLERIPSGGKEEPRVFSPQKLKNINKKNGRGETLLHLACMRNKVARVQELLSVPGVDVNVQDHAGWTPLHEACNHGHVDCVLELLKFKPKKMITGYFHKDHKTIDFMIKGEGGITPLHDAVMNSKFQCAKLLLQYGGGSLTEAKTDKGALPLDFAQTPELRQLLSSYKNIPNPGVLSSQLTNESNGTIAQLSNDTKISPGYYAKVLGHGTSRNVFTQQHCLRITVIYCTLINSYINFYHVNSNQIQYQDDVDVFHLFSDYVEKFKNHLCQLVNKSDVQSSEIIIGNLLRYFSFWKSISFKCRSLD